MELTFIERWLMNLHESDSPTRSDALLIPSPKITNRRVPLSPNSTPPPSRKRQRMMETPQKRRLEIALDEDTPRPKRKSTTTASRSTRTTSSISTGGASARKEFGRLELGNEGVTRKTLSADDPALPDALVDVLADLGRISRGVGVVDEATWTAIQNDGRFRLKVDDVAIRRDRAALGHTPPPGNVIQIVQMAMACADDQHDEASWNLEVHAKILALAFRQSEGGLDVVRAPVDFVSCTTASILDAYLPRGPSRKVDFCVVVDPASAQQIPGCDPSQVVANAEAAASIEKIREQNPGLSINYTDYFPLRKRPVAMAIETKRVAEDWDKAALQVGVWASASWRALEQLVMHSLPPGTDVSPSLPPFLPIMIVQGHQWHFAATTREGKRTVLWTGGVIGSTESTLGVYQIVAVLQMLRKWIVEVFWPLLERALLARGTPVE